MNWIAALPPVITCCTALPMGLPYCLRLASHPPQKPPLALCHAARSPPDPNALPAVGDDPSHGPLSLHRDASRPAGTGTQTALPRHQPLLIRSSSWWGMMARGESRALRMSASPVTTPHRSSRQGRPSRRRWDREAGESMSMGRREGQRRPPVPQRRKLRPRWESNDGPWGGRGRP